MATELPAKVESELAPAKVETPVDVAPEKPVDPPTVPETKADDSKTLAVAEKTSAPEVVKKGSSNSLDRDVALSELEKEKQLSFIKAWEETEKSKVENKAQKELSAITAWENTKRADIEAKLKQIEEKMDKKKAEYGEKMKNKVGLIHKQAEEKRAMVEAQKGENKLKAEELAAKYRATGTLPKKFLLCFGG
ncbi:remorin [Cynara cardunculus var. scolymus]|uniref:Remorin, C-terminal n=1 Tax=Cynara cardunculus var. scolymus TaxID=59895 RepID=A0A103XE74_CYNCS|nr:remorin [Cynara cardunculus var. scolymus]KVH89116.1 Remorin, C-terminal [Cynara cardunculus var. scolymus]